MRVLVDELLRERLHNFESTLEIVDETGAVLGKFVPNLAYELGISQEELHQRMTEKGGRPLAEILADLEARS